MTALFDEYAPFDSGAGANVTEDTWRKMIIHAGKPSGVIRGFDLALQVFADSSGMQVKVPTGQVWIQGHWGGVTSTKTLALTAANSSLARKDLVVARADFVNNRVELDVITGTPAASPTLPTVTQTTSVHEIALAQVDVAAAATSISSGNVTDKRGFTSAVARYRKSSTQSIPNATSTKVTFPTVVTFSGDIVPNTAHSEFTLNRDGWWLMSTGGSWSTGTTGHRSLAIGTAAGSLVVEQKVSASTDECQVNASTALQVVAGTAYSVYAHQNEGGAENLETDIQGTWVSFTWIDW